MYVQDVLYCSLFILYFFMCIVNLVYKNLSKKNNTFDLFNASLRNKSTKNPTEPRCFKWQCGSVTPLDFYGKTFKKKEFFIRLTKCEFVPQH